MLMAVLCTLLMAVPTVSAHHKTENKVEKILYIPHDNRPISDKQTAEVVEKLGYEVVVPPDDMLGSRDDLGKPDELWNWLQQNAQDADAAVISSDSMLYGSLVGSRKHEYSKNEVLARADRFKSFRKEHPKMQLYVFGSIMRTPRTGEASGHEEPGYYRNYGSDIFRYTVLKDKEEMEGLTRREKKEYEFLGRLIPKKSLADWMGRREKNFAANEKMIQLTRDNAFNYFVLGRDDNAPYSQTHLESRHLSAEGKDLGKTRFQAMAGIDEIGMLMLTRAVNDIRRDVPFVFVRYNWGRGEFTVPSYSDEKIGDSIASAITAAGGMQVKSPEKADLVLTVNTNPNGRTGEANDRDNDGTPREGTKYFADIVSDYVAKGYPVGVADIAYANGSDNALMNELRDRGLLFKIRAYAGWNTPTNSTGFVIGEGMLTRHMKDDAVDQLLITRYLDDWAYQANVRNIIARQLTWLRGDGVYGSLDSKVDAVSRRSSRMMTRFVEDNLPPFDSLAEIDVRFPWNRMFEADIQHSAKQEVNYFAR
ncbi:DUF4127 family protein [Mitsuokella sp. AF21-1AC]|uniref:DUF4127 family protein n=1 Tax=Mitsuokella sp. AF21-1AC TaxID=2292235 RepID=UPI000E487950|nr:DUF4127 family protein [Mitsuokella sp. AF21-1AC]